MKFIHGTKDKIRHRQNIIQKWYKYETITHPVCLIGPYEACKYACRFVQNCNICKQQNLPKQSYSYIHMTPRKRHFDYIASNLVRPFHPPSTKSNSYI